MVSQEGLVINTCLLFRSDLLTLVLKSFVFKDKKNVNEFEEEFSKFLDYKEYI